MLIKKIYLLIIPGILVLSACQSQAIAISPTASVPTTIPGGQSSPSPSVIVQGYVEPEYYVDISLLSSGQVEEILVAEGDTVQQGQIIARLSGGEVIEAQIAQAKQEVLAAGQAVDSLNKNADLAYAQALQTLSTAQDDLDDAQRKYNYLGEIRGSKDQIAAANANYILAQDEVDRMQNIYNNKSNLEEDDPERALALANLENARKARDKALVNLNWYKGKPTEKEIAEIEANLAAAQAAYDLAEQDVENLKNGPDPDELAAANSRIETAKASLESAQYSLNSLELKAPSNGTLATLTIKVGEVVQSGHTAATIADFSTWIINTDDLTEIEVVDIKLDQTVQVKLDSLPGKTMTGVVEKIATRFEEKRGDITYTVTIRMEDPDPSIRWGMTAQVIFGSSQ